MLLTCPFWAYSRRAEALASHAPSDFDVTICYHSHAPAEQLTKNHDLSKFDLLFNICYMTRGFENKILRGRMNTKLVISHNRDSKSNLERWDDSYDPVQKVDGFLICNNLEVFQTNGRLPRTCNISNGIDGDLWGVDVPIADRPKTLLWYGSANPKKGKGWDNIIRPLMPIMRDRGFEWRVRPFGGGRLSDWAFDQQKQREWYNSGFAILCASEAEGTPNSSLEGMACGCVPVSTFVGNICEFGRDGENCVISERNVDAFVNAIEYAWENRWRLANAARDTMKGWTYGAPGNRAEYFFQLFRRLIDDGADSIEPFSYCEKSPGEI